MCGRYELPNTPKSWSDLHALLNIGRIDPPVEFGEVKPTNAVPILTNVAHEEWTTAKWWLDGPWSAGGKKLTLINARVDKLESPFWKRMVEKQRCVVPAASFYEWRPVAGLKKKRRVRIGMADGSPFVMAGLWNRWNDATTFTIVTTEGNETMSGIHDRMPVILTKSAIAPWLKAAPMPVSEARSMMGPFDSALMQAADAPEPETDGELRLF